MKKIKHTLIITICAILVPIACDAAQKLTAGFINFPPYVVVDKTVGGIVVEKVTAAMSKAGISYTLVSYPPKRIFTYFKNGTVDMIIVTEGRIDEFAPYALISNEPFMKIYVKIYAKTDISIPADIRNIKGVIGIINGYNYDKMLMGPDVEIYNVNSHDSLFRMLDRGRLDYAIDYSVPSDTAIRENNIKGLKSNFVKEINLYFGIRKSFPDSEQTLQNIVQHYHD